MVSHYWRTSTFPLLRIENMTKPFTVEFNLRNASLLYKLHDALSLYTRRLSVLIFSVGLTSMGCWSGSGMSPVEGIVQQNGQPVPAAFVFFRPEKGKSSAGTTDANGRYTLSSASGEMQGAVVGPHQVTITLGISPEPVADGKTVTNDGALKLNQYVLPEPVIVKSGGNNILLVIPNETSTSSSEPTPE